MLLDSSYLIDLEEEIADRKFGPMAARSHDTSWKRMNPGRSVVISCDPSRDDLSRCYMQLGRKQTRDQQSST